MSHLPRINLGDNASTEKPRVRLKNRVFSDRDLDALGATPKASEAELQQKLQQSQEQADRAEDLFNKYDVMGRNTLSRVQFVACLESLGVRDRFPGAQFAAKVAECFDLFDKDHDGSIDREEFAHFYNWLVLDDVLGKKQREEEEQQRQRERLPAKDEAVAAKGGKKAKRDKKSKKEKKERKARKAAAAAATAAEGGGEQDKLQRRSAPAPSPTFVRIHGVLESKFPEGQATAAKRRALTPIRRHPAAERAERQPSPLRGGRPKSGNLLEQAAAAAAVRDQPPPRQPLKPGVDKALVRQHVKSALKAVRDVLCTTKGQQILVLEAKKLAATREGRFEVTRVRRAAPADPLGLSFIIPPRIMAVGWASAPFLVLSGGALLADHGLQLDDIVVACDGAPVSTIEQLQAATKGKTDMELKVVRIAESELGDLAKTQKYLEKNLKAAVKIKVTEHLLQGREEPGAHSGSSAAVLSP